MPSINPLHELSDEEHVEHSKACLANILIIISILLSLSLLFQHTFFNATKQQKQQKATLLKCFFKN